MRRAAIGLLLTASFTLSATAGMRPTTADLTVVLDFQGPRSEKSVRVMEKETQGILKSSGLRLDWRGAEEASQHSYNDLVVVHFKGSCVVREIPYVYDELGPLAFTYTSDGNVQPFTVVECDKIVRSVRSAMWGGDFGRAELLLGRALGRVVAHELVHILTDSGQHGTEGVQKAALSGNQLIETSLTLSPEDLARLKEKHKTH
jgi:hypothetical protein